MCRLRGVDFASIQAVTYRLENENAVRHLLTVSASLDSMVLGEPQISAQVKEAYRLTTQAGTGGKIINRLFHCAFATSKEVYAMTSITQRRVSVAGVAVALAQQLFGKLARARTVVIGAGEMGELLIRHLLEVECRDITILNRTQKRAELLATEYQVAAAPWEELAARLAQADIVIAAALAQEYLFGPELLEGRRGGPLLILDISVPRNFDPAVNRLRDVYLFSIDDLARVARENLEARQEDLGQAREIIADNVASFMDWFGVMDIGPLIGKLRDRFHELSRGEMERFLAGEKDLTPIQRQKMEAMTSRIVNKIIHRLIDTFHTIARTQGMENANQLIEDLIEHPERMLEALRE